jgi:hypothetical protein
VHQAQENLKQSSIASGVERSDKNKRLPPKSSMAENYPYIVRCNDCEFVSQVYLDEQQAMNERDFHSFEHLHSVSIWRYAWEQWTLVTELMGVDLH